MKQQIISLYCGGGGIDEGLKQAGIKTTLAIDVEKDCLETIKLNHPGCEVICGKVEDYIESLPKALAVVGGPPCPAFSRAKSDRTFDLCEVNNFWKAVEHCKPEYHLMENVPDIAMVLRKDRFWLVNCADYGVPQTRIRRFYTNLPIPKPTHAKTPSSDLFGNKLKKWVSVREALGLDGIIQDRKTTFGDGFRNYSTDNPNFTVLSDGRVWYVSPLGFANKNKKLISRSVSEPSQTITNGNEYQFTSYKVYSTKYIRGKNPIMYKKYPPNHLDASCSTITAKDRSTASDMITDNLYARKLINEELAILQGFPKEYRFYGNKTSVRKQIGNAVPPPVINAFFSQITNNKSLEHSNWKGEI